MPRYTVIGCYVPDFQRFAHDCDAPTARDAEIMVRDTCSEALICAVVEGDVTPVDTGLYADRTDNEEG